jgi:hypothetical protein
MYKHFFRRSGHEEIARIAYRLWESRGRPSGSPEVVWFQAEEVLRRLESRNRYPFSSLSKGPETS